MGEIKQKKEGGIAVVELVLLLVIVAAIVGVGLYVARQKTNTESTLSTANSSNSSVPKAPQGTSASVEQLTEQDASSEAAADHSADTSVQQDAASANGAASNLGGAYNESNF